MDCACSSNENNSHVNAYDFIKTKKKTRRVCSASEKVYTHDRFAIPPPPPFIVLSFSLHFQFDNFIFPHFFSFLLHFILVLQTTWALIVTPKKPPLAPTPPTPPIVLLGTPKGDSRLVPELELPLVLWRSGRGCRGGKGVVSRLFRT